MYTDTVQARGRLLPFIGSIEDNTDRDMYDRQQFVLHSSIPRQLSQMTTLNRAFGHKRTYVVTPKASKLCQHTDLPFFIFFAEAGELPFSRKKTLTDGADTERCSLAIARAPG